MKISLISSLAFAGAMMLSTATFAQDATAAAPTMIGQQNVSAEDLPKVQAQCNTLAGVEVQSMASEGAQADGATTENADGASDLGTDSETPDGTATATSATDLALITIEDCKAAGLSK